MPIKVTTVQQNESSASHSLRTVYVKRSSVRTYWCRHRLSRRYNLCVFVFTLNKLSTRALVCAFEYLMGARTDTVRPFASVYHKIFRSGKRLWDTSTHERETKNVPTHDVMWVCECYTNTDDNNNNSGGISLSTLRKESIQDFRCCANKI